MTGAERVVETLIREGVRTLFSVSGNQIMSIYDAIIGRDIKLIHTRHEAAAVHMADGWGRLTGEPGVALVTAGPGHANTPSTLYVALMAESPVVLLSGHAQWAHVGRGAFQEMDQVAMAKLVSKAAWLVDDPKSLEEDIAKAFQIARSGRPGPVHLSIPEDVLKSEGKGTPRRNATLTSKQLDAADKDFIKQVHAVLLEAKRPLILAGPAMARGSRWETVRKLSEVTGIPALPMMSPRGMNDPWLHEAVNCLTVADLVLLAGKKLDFSLRFGEAPPFAADCRFIQVDADTTLLREDPRVILRSHNDPVLAIRQLLDTSARGPAHDQWRVEVASARRTVPVEWGKYRTENSRPIHPLRVCEALQPFLDAGGMFVSDGGEFGQWVQAGLEASTRLINGPAGSIGSSIPMALGAKSVQPSRAVFALLGDGTFGYHAMEFDTAVRYNLPIVAIVGNDARWNAEYQIQINTYGQDRTIGCELLPSRYERIAQALGGYGVYVENACDLTEAIGKAVVSGLPACVNVAIEGVGAPSLLG